MKTLIVYNSTEQELNFLIVDGDYSKFNNIYINYSNTGFEQEFIDWFFDETGMYRFDISNNIKSLENKNWDKVAIVTWTP